MTKGSVDLNFANRINPICSEPYFRHSYSKLTRYVIEFVGTRLMIRVFNLVSRAMATRRLAKYQENQISNCARGRDRIIIQGAGLTRAAVSFPRG